MGLLGPVCHLLVPLCSRTMLHFTGERGSRQALLEPLESSSPLWREGLPQSQTGVMGMGRALRGPWASGGKRWDQMRLLRWLCLQKRGG